MFEIARDTPIKGFPQPLRGRKISSSSGVGHIFGCPVNALIMQ